MIIKGPLARAYAVVWNRYVDTGAAVSYAVLAEGLGYKYRGAAYNLVKPLVEAGVLAQDDARQIYPASMKRRIYNLTRMPVTDDPIEVSNA